MLELKGKPLIYYTFEAARKTAGNDPICVSTDDDYVISFLEKSDYQVPFKRPADLATDTSRPEEVIQHAVAHYQENGFEIDTVIYLQPTSPLRTSEHIKEAIELFNDDFDMLVSVKVTDANPYFVLYEENENGYLESSKDGGDISRRQDAPVVYQVNGAIYIIRIASLEEYKRLKSFPKIGKYVMDSIHSVDIDDKNDMAYCTFLAESGYLPND